MKPTSKLFLEKCAFRPIALAEYAGVNDYDEFECIKAGQFENARLAPIHARVRELIEAANETVLADTRREAAMGVYIIRLEDALANLRAALEEGK